MTPGAHTKAVFSVPLDHPSKFLPSTKYLRCLFWQAAADMRPQGPAPDLGEHTGAVLESLGLSDGDRQQLAQAGAFGSVPSAPVEPGRPKL